MGLPFAILPFVSDVDARAVKSPQGYWSTAAMFGADVVTVPAGGIVSRPMNWEYFRSFSAALTIVAGTKTVLGSVGFYDAEDDATLLARTIFFGGGGFPGTTIVDFGTGSAGSFQGRVCDIELTQGGGAGGDPDVSFQLSGRM
jgi:hypothetical protein